MATNQQPKNLKIETPDNDYLISLEPDKPLPIETELHSKQLSVVDKTNVSSSLQVDSEEETSKVRWWHSWQLWGFLVVLLSGGIGYKATSSLLKSPQSQDCSKLSKPVASMLVSASARIGCANNLAEEKTVESLLEAISLVEKLPQDHPIRPEINRNIEKWANNILELGEIEFQQGNMEAAVSIAKSVPENLEARALVDAKVEEWEKIWSKAEAEYRSIDKFLQAFDWSQSFSAAVRLTYIKNKYWSTTKYQETIDLINIAQEERSKVDKAVSQVKSADVDVLLEGINQAVKIPSTSYAYAPAQEVIEQGKQKLLIGIDEIIKKQNWNKLLSLSHRIPGILKLDEKVKDWKIIGGAGSSAKLGTVLGLEDAITEIDKLDSQSPLYNRGQQLRSRWTLEIEDVKHLAKARELAQNNSIRGYNAAIAEVSLVPRQNPRYSEAQQEIGKWRKEIRIIQDRPIIKRAKQLASAGNVTAWRSAIAEINRVNSTSPLSQEARRYARSWQINIERVEDRPILNEAVTLAGMSNYSGAIATAQKIRSGRALYAEARKNIDTWNSELKGERYINEANTLASQRTPDSLNRAIRVIRQVPRSSSVFYQVVPSVNSWSEDILNLAQNASYSSLSNAIAIAKKVPYGTVSYDRAQSKIKFWQDKLKPAPPKPLEPLFPLKKSPKSKPKLKSTPEIIIDTSPPRFKLDKRK